MEGYLYKSLNNLPRKILPEKFGHLTILVHLCAPFSNLST